MRNRECERCPQLDDVPAQFMRSPRMWHSVKMKQAWVLCVCSIEVQLVTVEKGNDRPEAGAKRQQVE